MTTYITHHRARIEDDGIWISMDGKPLTDEVLRQELQDEVDRLQRRLRGAERRLAKFDAKYPKDGQQ